MKGDITHGLIGGVLGGLGGVWWFIKKNFFFNTLKSKYWLNLFCKL